MSYGDLVRMYFERSFALQWYWTVYILVIGGVLAFSAFRRQRESVTCALLMLLYVGFAYRNLGAIVATAEERQAVLAAVKEAPVPPDVQRVRERLEPTMPAYDIAGARLFHLACDAGVLVFLGVREWYRGKAGPAV